MGAFLLGRLCLIWRLSLLTKFIQPQKSIAEPVDVHLQAQYCEHEFTNTPMA